jgi:cytochrome c biogenesis protein CcdA
MSATAPLLALVAGLLTILSPCVLPLAPIVAAGAIAQHRLGPLALAAGLGLSFSAVGLFVATVGFAVGVDNNVLRLAGAVVMLIIGAALAIPKFTHAFETALGPLSAWSNRTLQRMDVHGLWGQAGIGALLGAVWSPCVGPTLGAATLLAAQQRELPLAGAVMAAFGLGAALALGAIGYGARALSANHRARLVKAGNNGKRVLGVLLSAMAMLTLSGLDRPLEAFLVSHTPSWLSEVATKL